MGTFGSNSGIRTDQLYIDGLWVASDSDETIDVINAATEEVMGRVPAGTPADVDRAVAAAQAAWGPWSATDRDERAKYLTAIGEGLQARMMDIATVITREVGMPINLAMILQAGLPIMTFGAMAELIGSFASEEQLGNSLVVREPIGVVGAITPWNYPLHQVAAKVTAAWAAGCAVVVKPSEVAPLSAFILAEVVDAAGLPPGVFNLVTGVGPVAGEALAGHPDVDMVSFTGSTRAGRRVGEVAAASIKRVTLELGGKSPNVILDDADLAQAVRDGVAKAFLNSGQTCSALTRMIVPRTQLAEVEDLAVAAAGSYHLGDPLVQGTRLGPVASAAQRDRVRGYIRAGITGGAKLLTGGPDPPEGLERGFFVRPTIFSEVDPGSVIAQEEIFGPVLTIIAYDTEAEAVEIANGTAYGLSAGVWSGDRDRALRVARRIRAGQVEINGGAFNTLAPFGGYKQSGNGRELGRFGLEEFLEVKSLQL